MRQGADSLSCSFLSLFLFLSLPLTVSRLFGLQAHSQAVLFALWMTVRKLTRLLVFEMYACDHTWKKDLQQWALAGGLWLFIPSFPKAIGLFFQGAHDLLKSWKKRGWSAKGDWRRGMGVGVLFRFFSSQVNPHYPGLQSLSKDCART